MDLILLVVHQSLHYETVSSSHLSRRVFVRIEAPFDRKFVNCEEQAWRRQTKREKEKKENLPWGRRRKLNCSYRLAILTGARKYHSSTMTITLHQRYQITGIYNCFDIFILDIEILKPVRIQLSDGQIPFEHLFRHRHAELFGSEESEEEDRIRPATPDVGMFLNPMSELPQGFFPGGIVLAQFHASDRPRGLAQRALVILLFWLCHRSRSKESDRAPLSLRIVLRFRSPSSSSSSSSSYSSSSFAFLPSFCRCCCWYYHRHRCYHPSFSCAPSPPFLPCSRVPASSFRSFELFFPNDYETRRVLTPFGDPSSSRRKFDIDLLCESITILTTSPAAAF